MAFLFFRKTSHSQCTFRHATSLTKPGPSSVLVFWWKTSRKYSPITNKTFYRAVSLAGEAKEKQQAQLKSPAKTISLFGFLPFFPSSASSKSESAASEEAALATCVMLQKWNPEVELRHFDTPQSAIWKYICSCVKLMKLRCDTLQLQLSIIF